MGPTGKYGARGCRFLRETEAVGAAVPCDRDRRVERVGLYLYIREYLTTWCNRRELAHPDNEDRPGFVREVL